MTQLVLLHAFPLDSQMYTGVARHMSHQLLTPDLPGFGGTAVPNAEPSLDVYADAVADELDRLQVGRVVLGGTSMGGYVTMAFARRHRDRVAGLALIDTKASADTPDAAQGRRAMAAQMLREQTNAPLLDVVAPKLLGETTARDRPEVVEQVRGWVSDAPPASAAFAQQAMAARPDSTDTLRALDVPSLIVVGTEDVLTPPAESQAMAEVLPDGELRQIDGVGHLSPVEAPAEVASVLDDLMGRVDG
ncbi:MAG TPA: alpha/beta hydrolase [Actinomycetes bacterium]|nr:alpha/beta hydrolase [Actinomycetes bacterium]